MSTEVLSVFRPLCHQERLDARIEAAKNLAGPEPQMASFDNHTPSRFSPTAMRTVNILAGLVLAAAFAISVPRLYIAGFESATEYADSAKAVAVIAGIAFCILAETAQVVFSLALAVLDTNRAGKGILWSMALAATAIAVVGNISIAQPPAYGEEMFLIRWLDALVPPVLVLGVAWVLKGRALEEMQLRYANNVAFAEAKKEWMQVQETPEGNARWTEYYMQALRDALLKANARSKPARSMRGTMQTRDWVALIKRELDADAEIKAVQAQMQAIELQGAYAELERASKSASENAVQKRASVTASKRVHKKPASASASNGLAAGVLSDAVQQRGEEWVASCPNCNRKFRKDNERAARLALTAHFKRCDVQPDKQPEPVLASRNGNGHSSSQG